MGLKVMSHWKSRQTTNGKSCLVCSCQNARCAVANEHGTLPNQSLLFKVARIVDKCNSVGRKST